MLRESTRLTHGAEEALFYSELLAKELWNKSALNEDEDKKHPLDIKREDVMCGYVRDLSGCMVGISNNYQFRGLHNYSHKPRA